MIIKTTYSITMRIQINQVFSSSNVPNFVNWQELTKGIHDSPLNPYKGMPYYQQSRGLTPALNFHSNPFKEEKDGTPWRDLIFQDEGRVIYNGDNKSANQPAFEAFGNKQVLSILKYYHSNSQTERALAPPIIVTQTVRLDKKTGYRKFVGFGLISNPPRLVHQYERTSENVFSNYQFEVTLLTLKDGEQFDWGWIDDRRDINIPIVYANMKAPNAWKEWIKQGSEVIKSNRLKIRSYNILSTADQLKMPQRNQQVITDLLEKFYPNPSVDGLRFEAMASFITELFFSGHKYHRGWITVGSADRGVDFVGRLDIGDDDFSKTSIVVLGQSKRYKNSISGEKLTRVASRLTRGYIGVVVTLNCFTELAQAEIRDDKLPIVLINGKKVSELLLTYLNSSGKSLEQLVKEQDNWARYNIGTEHYDSILNS